MTKLIVRGRTKRKVRKRDYPHKFVVYLTKHGRTEPGIYERIVSFDGKLAFVLPPGDRATADIVPRMNVFDDKEDAHRYFTKEGVLKWVVYRDHGHGLRVFQARVRSYVQRRHGNWAPYVTSIVKTDGEVLTARYDVVVYDTEKDAYRHLASTLKDDLKDAEEKIEEGTRKKEDILRVKRRMVQLGVARGYRKRRV